MKILIFFSLTTSYPFSLFHRQLEHGPPGAYGPIGYWQPPDQTQFFSARTSMNLRQVQSMIDNLSNELGKSLFKIINSRPRFEKVKKITAQSERSSKQRNLFQQYHHKNEKYKRNQKVKLIHKKMK